MTRAGVGDDTPGRIRELMGPPGRRAVLLTDPDEEDAARRWRHDLRDDQLTELIVDDRPEPSDDDGKRTTAAVVHVADLDDVLAALARNPAPDILVVALGPAGLRRLVRNQRRLFERLFPHLGRGGAFVVDRTTGADPGSDPDADFRDALAGRGRGDGAGRFVRRAHVESDVAVLIRRGRHAVKLREDQVGVLPTREPGTELTVLETRPAGRLEVRMTETSHGPSRAEPWPAHLDYPEMALRHYRGDLLSLGRMRLYAGQTVLPESFRWPHSWMLRHPRIPYLTPDIAGLARHPGAPVLEGDYYFVDCLFSGHFGHLTTEVLCRLWGWDRAKQELPGLKAIFHTNRKAGRDGSLERRLLTAFGIAPSDQVAVDGPVRLRSVVGASPMWHNKEPFYAHPDIRETWARVTAGLLEDEPPSGHDRIFVSRGASLGHRRGCRNQDEVERFFAAHGFHVFYPEDLPLREQVALFRGARVIAGFGGSAMFNLLHAERLEAVVVLSHHGYTARNEHLFASVLGSDLHYFWQQSDVAPREDGRRSTASDRSTFSVDLDGQADDLRRILAGS